MFTIIDKMKSVLNEFLGFKVTNSTGCNLEEITHIEQEYNLKLPQIYKDFLLNVGKNDIILPNSDMIFDYNLFKNYQKHFLEDDKEFSFPDNMFIFALDDLASAFFFYTNEGVDPKIFKYYCGNINPVQISCSFSEFLDLNLENIISDKFSVELKEKILQGSDILLEEFGKNFFKSPTEIIWSINSIFKKSILGRFNKKKYISLHDGLEIEMKKKSESENSLVKKRFKKKKQRISRENTSIIANIEKLIKRQIFIAQNSIELNKSPSIWIVNDKIIGLNLNFVGLKEIPSIIRQLKDLKYLSLKQNLIKIIEKSSFQNPNLKNLCLKYNHIEYIGNISKDLSSIGSLDLSMNKIKEIPCDFINLIHLHELNLADNRIEKLPEDFFLLKNLQNLNLSRNEIINLPTKITELNKLNILDLSFNKLISLSNNFNKFLFLQYLNLSNNRKLKNIDKICWDFENLVDLNLKKCNLDFIPASFINLSAIRWLNLDQNNLKELPSFLGRIKTISFFSANWNKIIKIPKNFFEIFKPKLFSFLGNNISQEKMSLEIQKHINEITIYI